ncbi:MAG: hypothetical protein ACTHJJ_07905, partial [Intrasporangium sp.]|uniref:hypothetical protein n=1 Tax=Intrasporangium sp. TaxID=1925024 RepID=UPI003F7D07FC
LAFGGGTVYLLPAGTWLSREVAHYDWSLDVLPVKSGSYRLTWDDEHADLRIDGSGQDVYMDEVLERC